MADFESILVTGGGGFVGGNLASVISLLYPKARRAMVTRPGERVVDSEWRNIVADITDEAALGAAVAQVEPDLVVHLAGQASIGQAVAAAAQTWRTNFLGAFNLAAAVARHAPQATVLFSSSATVYGAALNAGIATEETSPQPLDSYSRSKVASEYAIADLLPPTARLIIGRPVNHSGPGQKSADFVLASFAAQIARMEKGLAAPALHVGDLSKARDFLDVRDVVDAYVRLIAKARDLPMRGNVFNIASGEAQRIGDLLEILRGHASIPFDVVVDRDRIRPSAVDVPVMICDATKLRESTGWRPRHSMDDMLRDLLAGWRAELAGGAAAAP